MAAGDLRVLAKKLQVPTAACSPPHTPRQSGTQPLWPGAPAWWIPFPLTKSAAQRASPGPAPVHTEGTPSPSPCWIAKGSGGPPFGSSDPCPRRPRARRPPARPPGKSPFPRGVPTRLARPHAAGGPRAAVSSRTRRCSSGAPGARSRPPPRCAPFIPSPFPPRRAPASCPCRVPLSWTLPLSPRCRLSVSSTPPPSFPRPPGFPVAPRRSPPRKPSRPDPRTPDPAALLRPSSSPERGPRGAPRAGGPTGDRCWPLGLPRCQDRRVYIKSCARRPCPEDTGTGPATRVTPCQRSRRGSGPSAGSPPGRLLARASKRDPSPARASEARVGAPHAHPPPAPE